MTDTSLDSGSIPMGPPKKNLLAGRTLSDGKKLFWWREVLIVLAVNAVYETVRNLSAGKPDKAYENALKIIDWQRLLGIWHEQAMQNWALNFTPLIIFANYFYGSMYIAATLFTLGFLYRKFPDTYPLFRNTLMIGTLCGLIGFAFFPLMPPRLLDDTILLQGLNAGKWFGFVDTLVEYPTFWSFNNEVMKTISNQFAAMPSLHCGWAFWTLIALLPRMKSWWSKTLVILYPVLTVYFVIITGNHFVLDAVAGFAVFTFAYLVARRFTRSGRGTPVTNATNAVTR
ncbi:MAG: phosphatase PAP2 family protein [Acidimicrobiales bacterium]